MLDHVPDAAVHGGNPDHQRLHRLANAAAVLRSNHRTANARGRSSYLLVALLVIANTINIAADLAAMGEALRLVVGGPALIFSGAFGIVCLVAEVFVPYHRYAGYLKFLTLVLLFYVAAAFSVQIPWGKVIALRRCAGDSRSTATIC